MVNLIEIWVDHKKVNHDIDQPANVATPYPKGEVYLIMIWP